MAMARWQPDSRGRLVDAALELFEERGFEGTTVTDIAARAGVTERTFFRHFSDKREVLFGGSAQLLDALVQAVAGAPADASALDAVEAGVAVAAHEIQGRAAWARRRQAVITANLELRERELVKLADYAEAISAALQARGVAEPVAGLAAEAGAAAFRIAVQRWAAGGDDADLVTVAHEAFAGLRAASAA